MLKRRSDIRKKPADEEMTVPSGLLKEESRGISPVSKTSLQEDENAADKSGLKYILSEIGTVANASQLGITMFVCVLIGVLGGGWLDKKLGSSPWFLLVGAILGSLAAIKHVLDQLKKGNG